MENVRLDPKKHHRLACYAESTFVPRERRGVFMLGKLGRRIDSEVSLDRRVMAEAVSDVLDVCLGVSLVAVAWGVRAHDLALHVAYAATLDALDRGADLERESAYQARRFYVEVAAVRDLLLEELGEPGETWAALVEDLRAERAHSEKQS